MASAPAMQPLPSIRPGSHEPPPSLRSNTRKNWPALPQGSFFTRFGQAPPSLSPDLRSNTHRSWSALRNPVSQLPTFGWFSLLFSVLDYSTYFRLQHPSQSSVTIVLTLGTFLAAAAGSSLRVSLLTASNPVTPPKATYCPSRDPRLPAARIQLSALNRPSNLITKNI